MTIRQLVDRLIDSGLSKVDIGLLIGRSSLQIQMYADGRTEKPGVKTALGVYRHISIDGQPVVVEDFRGKQDIFDKVAAYATQCSQVVRDEGVGHYDIVT